VLLLTLGSTPQVVTETIHALITQDPPWIPDRIVLATTDHGARLFREGRSIEGRRSIEPLLGPDGMIARLAEQFGVDLPSGCIEVEVPLGNGGHPIEDIRTEDETKSFAECLLRIVSGVTATAGTELHVSLAGGRKTMSFIAGQIMSMFGRHQDHLSHVLVEPQALEREDGFWWPGDSSPGSDEACVKLYLVPFFRARAWLDPARLVDVSPGYALTVDMANQSLGRVHTEIDLSENTLHMCGRTIELGAQQLAALSLIFIAAKRALPLESVLGWCSTDGKRRGLAMSGDRKTTHRLWAFLNSCCRLQKIYEGDLVVHFASFDQKVAELAEKFSVDDHMASPLSRLRQELEDKLPAALAERVVSARGFATFLDPADITIFGPADLADHPEWPPELLSSRNRVV